MALSDFPQPYPVQFKGSRLALWVLRTLGWRVHFAGFPALQGVAIVYPHTSNWDFIYMILAKWGLGIPARFWAKDTLFRIPVFGPWLRHLGGVSIDRSSPRGVVGEMVQILQSHKERNAYFWLGLSPEGTRKFQPGWRSGFYQLAWRAQVPLCLIRLDYARQEVCVDQFIRLSGDEAQDYVRMAQAFDQVKGFHPAQACPIQPIRSTSSEEPRA